MYRSRQSPFHNFINERREEDCFGYCFVGHPDNNATIAETNTAPEMKNSSNSYYNLFVLPDYELKMKKGRVSTHRGRNFNMMMTMLVLEMFLLLR